MQVSYNQKIVTIVADDPRKNTKFWLSGREQLDEVERTYEPGEVASIDVELINDKESLKVKVHRYITTKHFDTLEHSPDFARQHYVA
jgi:hypothetical protein